jgi:hypothetical protein
MFIFVYKIITQYFDINYSDQNKLNITCYCRRYSVVAEGRRNFGYGKIFPHSGALVRQRTIPTERPPLVGEVSANFSGQRVSRGQRNESPRPLISVL